MSFKKGDRVVLQSSFKYHQTEIESGTIGTITILLNDEVAIVRYGYNSFENKQMIAGVPIDLLRSATIDELSSARYEDLISPCYHVGNSILVGLGVSFKDIKTNDVGVIIDYSLTFNEQDDLLAVKFVKNNEDVIHSLKVSFIEAYCNPYSEELESQLGDQIDLKSAEKNYHLIGARMFLESKKPENIVILANKCDDGYFEVINIDGIMSKVLKGLLLPITTPEIFASEGYDKFIRREFSIDKRFKAKDSIAKHALLNKEFQPNDVVKVIHINEIFVNSYDDTVVVERTGGDAIVVSISELTTYFEPFKGLIKQTKGTVISSSNNIPTSDSLEAFEKVEVEEQPSETVIMMPLISDTPKDVIIINDITINGFRFKIDDRNVVLNHNDEITTENLNNYIHSLKILKKYI